MRPNFSAPCLSRGTACPPSLNPLEPQCCYFHLRRLCEVQCCTDEARSVSWVIGMICDVLLLCEPYRPPHTHPPSLLRARVIQMYRWQPISQKWEEQGPPLHDSLNASALSCKRSSTSAGRGRQKLSVADPRRLGHQCRTPLVVAVRRRRLADARVSGHGFTSALGLWPCYLCYFSRLKNGSAASTWCW